MLIYFNEIIFYWGSSKTKHGIGDNNVSLPVVFCSSAISKAAFDHFRKYHII